MGNQSRQNQALDAQARQADALERIANALERLANKYAPAGTQKPREVEEHVNGIG